MTKEEIENNVRDSFQDILHIIEIELGPKHLKDIELLSINPDVSVVSLIPELNDCEVELKISLYYEPDLYVIGSRLIYLSENLRRIFNKYKISFKNGKLSKEGDGKIMETVLEVKPKWESSTLDVILFLNIYDVLY